MKINTSYPYPVLSKHNDDYLNSEFTTEANVHEQFGEVIIEGTHALNNREIKRLIDSHQATYMIHVECSQTSFRKAYEHQNESFHITIPAERLTGKIDIHSFIIAKTRINHYMNEQLNDWFKHMPITFEKGNFIAIGTSIEATIYEDNLELLNIPSIVRVAKSKRNDYMEVDMSSDLITISLPEYEYNQYAEHAKSMLQQTILSTVIVPSLVYVFSKISEDSDDLREYTWYQVLEKILEENNISIEEVGTDAFSALKAAQMVLRKPLQGSFKEIEKLTKMED